MSYLLDLSKLSVVFISFDEPEADKNFATLQESAPSAIRVHGVKGFDAAHKRAGELATTAHIITVDGDNRLTEPLFFKRQLKFTPQELSAVVSFSARLPHNGLIYGNGGIKIWPRPVLRGLRTHESSRDNGQGIDFAWRIPYVQAVGTPSDSVVTSTPYMAFRAGLREGVRLTMHHGVTGAARYPALQPAEAIQRHLTSSVIERLVIWCSVGSDIKNGNFAILGARVGCVMAMLERTDVEKISDFDWIAKKWENQFEPLVSSAKALDAEIASYGRRIVNELELLVEHLTSDGSKFAKSIYHAPRRLGTLLPQ